jgi:hypothetical protein
MSAPWLREDGEGVVVTVHAQPGARSNQVIGGHGDALKVRLAAAPVEGRANACLIAYLAERLAMPRSGIEILSGAGARRKRVRIHGVSPADVVSGLAGD